MSEFEIQSIADLPSVNELWQAISAVQDKAKTRLLSESDVKSGKFLLLCEAALKFCEMHNLDKGSIEVLEDGGAVPNAYRHAAQTSAMFFNGARLICDRPSARHVANGDGGVRYCRIRVPASNPARKLLKEEGWISDRDQYARITEKSLARVIPQPKSNDAVLSKPIAQPRPTDVVRGGNVALVK
jgi:hypothetical protein